MTEAIVRTASKMAWHTRAVILFLTFIGLIGFYAINAQEAKAVQPGAIFTAMESTPDNANGDNVANVDPIVAPGNEVASAHPHQFCGASGVASNSTATSLVQGPTNFAEQGVRSGLWTPEIKYNGTHLDLTGDLTPGGSDPMKDCLIYYREVNNVTGDNIPGQFVEEGNGIPFGLKMVLTAGTYNGRVVNLGDELIFKCGPGSTGDLPAPPSQCSSGQLSVSARFPTCWDGVNLDTKEPDGDAAVNPVTQVAYPNDHISHMQYLPCDADHPIEIIRVEQFFRFWYGTGTHDTDLLTFGGNHWSTFHTDYMFAWRDETMADFMEKCILTNTACSNNVVAEGGLDDGTGLPPGQTGPTGTGPSGPTSETGPPTDNKPILVAEGTLVGTSSTDITVAPGSAHSTGNYELLVCEGNDDGTPTLTTANGFSQITGSPVSAAGAQSDSTRLTVFARTWDGSAGSPVVSRGSLNHVACVIVSFDHGTISSYTTSSETTADNSGSVGVPSGTTGLVVVLAANGKPDSNQSTTVTPGGTLTEVVDQAQNLGSGGLVWIGTDANPTALDYTTTYNPYKANIALRIT